MVVSNGYDPTGLKGLSKEVGNPFGDFWDTFTKNLGDAFTQHQVGYGATSSGGGMMLPLKSFTPTTPAPVSRGPNQVTQLPPVADRYDRGTPEPEGPDKDFQYYWNLMNGLTEQGPNWDSLRENYKDSAANVQERTAAMYRALQGQRETAGSKYGDVRNQTGANIQANADSAAADIQDAYNNAYQTQASELAQLGIADTLLGSPTQNMMEDSGYNQGLAEQLGSSYANANELGRAADLAYNQDMIGVAGFADAENRANIDQQLLSQLANLDFQQSQQDYDRSMNMLGLATGAQALDSAVQPFSPSWDQQQSALDSEAKNSQWLQQFQADQYQKLLEQYNGDAPTAQAAYDAMMRMLGLA